MGVKLKHNANRAMIDGKRVVLVDDSIVRGTTSQKILQMVRDAGAARSAHAHRLAADQSSCFYGVDTPERASCSPRACRSRRWRDFIGVDSLNFVSIDGLYRAVGEAAPQPRRAAILRRLLLRRLSDPPDRRSGGTKDVPNGRQLSLLSLLAAGLNLDKLSRRVALVTGASRGIGKAAAMASPPKARISSPSRAPSAASGTRRRDQAAGPRRRWSH